MNENNTIIFEQFIGKTVRLTLFTNSFTIYGVIDAVSDDFITFRTRQKTSLINRNEVKDIVLLHGVQQ